MLAASMFIMPYGDDWGYYTEPQSINRVASALVLPGAGHWRPIDVAFGLLLGVFPTLYPGLNHVVVVLGHALSTFMLFKIGRRIGFSLNSSYVASILFFVSGNSFATSFSVDSINQSLCLGFGALSIWSVIKKDNVQYGSYLIWSVLAAACKETGFIFFIIGPTIRLSMRYRSLSSLRNVNAREEVPPFVVGGVLTLLYFVYTFGPQFVVRMAHTTTREFWGNQSYYNLPFGFLALVGRVLPVDLPSLLISPPNHAVAVVSIAFGLPLVIVSAYHVTRLILRGDSFVIVISIGILGVAVSHALVNAITEMNSYPCIFFFSFFLMQGLEGIATSKHLSMAMVSLFAVASIVTLVHKYSIIIDSNKMANIVVHNIIKESSRKPERVYIMLIDNESLGHDIYQAIPPIGAGNGQIMKMVWHDWNMDMVIASYQVSATSTDLVHTLSTFTLDAHNAEKTLDAIAHDSIKTYDAVWKLYQDGSVTVLER